MVLESTDLAKADNLVLPVDKDQANHPQPSLGPIHDDEEITSPNRTSSVRSKPSLQSSPRKKFSRSESPGFRRSSTGDGGVTRLPPGEPSAPNRGSIHSITNPELIPDTSRAKKNPFFETMPGPEVWHRRMPPYFTFGETPFMERVMSRQIHNDLAGGKCIADVHSIAHS